MSTLSKGITRSYFNYAHTSGLLLGLAIILYISHSVLENVAALERRCSSVLQYRVQSTSVQT